MSERNDDERIDDEQLERDARELLRLAGAVPREITLEPGWAERGEAALARALAGEADGATVTPLRRARRFRALGAAATALVAAAAVTAVIVISPWHTAKPAAAAATPPMLTFPSAASGKLPASGSDPAARLGDLADQARTLTVSGSGDVQYVQLEQWWTSVDEIRARVKAASTQFRAVRTDSYLLPGNRVRLIDRLGPSLDAQGRIVRTEGNAMIRSDRTVPSDHPSAYAASLPIVPEVLARTLAKAAGCVNLAAHCLLQILGQVESSSVVPPTLQSAIWKALALTPDLTYIGRTVDRLHRTALTFMTTSWDPTQRTLVFADPSTGAWLGTETVQVAKSADFPTTVPAVLSFTAVVRSALVTASQLP